MITKFLKHQYRSGTLFYIFYTLGASLVGIWAYYSRNVEVTPKDTPKIAIILWLLWFVSLVVAEIYHIFRWNIILTSSERFLLFSSYKLKPEIFLFGEILYFILDLFLFTIWINLLGAIVGGFEKYISFHFLLIKKLYVSDFYLLIHAPLSFFIIYLWALTLPTYWSTFRRFSKLDYAIISLFVLAIYLNVRLYEFIEKSITSVTMRLIVLLLTDFSIFIALIVFNLKALKKGLDT